MQKVFKNVLSFLYVRTPATPLESEPATKMSLGKGFSVLARLAWSVKVLLAGRCIDFILKDQKKSLSKQMKPHVVLFKGFWGISN